MYRWIKEVLEECDTCLRNATALKSKSAEFHHLRGYQPFGHVIIDHFGPFPIDGGFKYALIAVCAATEYVVCVPTESTDAKTVALFLYLEICLRYGIPNVVHSDNGPGFVDDLLEGLLEILNVTHSLSLPYHPQGSGKVENRVKQISRILAKSCIGKGNWVSYLPQAVAGHNWHSVKRLGDVSPHELVYCYAPRAASELFHEITRKGEPEALPYQTPEDVMRYYQLKRVVVNELRKTVEERRFLMQEVINEEKCMELPMDLNFKKGDLVMLENEPLKKKKGKLRARYYGPYIVVETFGLGGIRLRFDDGKERIVILSSVILSKTQQS